MIVKLTDIKYRYRCTHVTKVRGYSYIIHDPFGSKEQEWFCSCYKTYGVRNVTENRWHIVGNANLSPTEIRQLSEFKKQIVDKNQTYTIERDGVQHLIKRGN